MQVTILEPVINLTERGPRCLLPGFAGIEDVTNGPNSKHIPSSIHYAGLAPKRSGGVHVSDLIRSIAIKAGYLKERPGGGDLEETSMPLQICIGLSWEDWLSQQYPEMLYHIGELELDGIAGSPDGITMFPDSPAYAGLGEACLEEFKLTWKSSRQPITDPKFWMWLCQIKAYCKMLPCLCARLHVTFVRADYSKGPDAPACLYRVFCLQFTQQELDQNWDLLLQEKALQEK